MRSCSSTVKPEKTRAGDHSACGVCRLKAAVTGVIELYSPSTRFHKVARGEKYWVLPFESGGKKIEDRGPKITIFHPPSSIFQWQRYRLMTLGGKIGG